VGQTGVGNVAKIDQENGANTQAAFQAGEANRAIVNQTMQPLGTGSGSNNAVTAQFGVDNRAKINQSMANPLGSGSNNSLTTQFGSHNTATVTQK
jgi:hypothetical protein